VLPPPAGWGPGARGPPGRRDRASCCVWLELGRAVLAQASVWCVSAWVGVAVLPPARAGARGSRAAGPSRPCFMLCLARAGPSSPCAGLCLVRIGLGRCGGAAARAGWGPGLAVRRAVATVLHAVLARAGPSSPCAGLCLVRIGLGRCGGAAARAGWGPGARGPPGRRDRASCCAWLELGRAVLAQASVWCVSAWVGVAVLPPARAGGPGLAVRRAVATVLHAVLARAGPSSPCAGLCLVRIGLGRCGGAAARAGWGGPGLAGRRAVATVLHAVLARAGPSSPCAGLCLVRIGLGRCGGAAARAGWGARGSRAAGPSRPCFMLCWLELGRAVLAQASVWCVSAWVGVAVLPPARAGGPGARGPPGRRDRASCYVGSSWAEQSLRRPLFGAYRPG